MSGATPTAAFPPSNVERAPSARAGTTTLPNTVRITIDRLSLCASTEPHRQQAASPVISRDLVRHQRRLNIGKQCRAFGKREPQFGNAAILRLHHGHDDCSDCRRARLLSFNAGFDDQTHGNSDQWQGSPA